MSDRESDEVEEIKISDIKDGIIKQQKEEEILNKKRQRKLNKKNKNKKINLLEKYKNELGQNLGEDLTNNANLLVTTKKVINIDENEDENVEKKKHKKLLKKNNIYIQFENTNQKEEYTPIPEDVLEFQKKHFYGERLNRVKNFMNKI